MGKFKSDIENLVASDTPSWNSGGTAHILPAERKKCTFEIETMTNFLDGGKKETFRRRWITGASDDIQDLGGKSIRFDLPRAGEKGALAQNFKHFMDIHKPHLDRMFIPQGKDMMYMEMGKTFGGYPGWGLFINTITSQCSPEQIGWWLYKAYTMQITGCYAQTELGHGSNVRGIETVAEYDVKTKEFVINTPTLTAMKRWITTSPTSTHCVLYAQLVIKGREYGVHAFFVQLRGANLDLLPGIEVGDLGTKVGENELDIGYMRFKNVRIPRRHMLEKKSHIEPDGTYVSHAAGKRSSDDKTHYLTMMGARVGMVGGASVWLAKGATIAIRYNCVRKQGFATSSKETDLASQSFKSNEMQIMDYKMNQYTLLKFLSIACAQRVVSNWLSEKMAKMSATLNGSDDKAKLMANAEFPELHASAAGLKGYCCYATAVGLEEMRKCCGGAGYLKASGIAPLEMDYKWRATAEGDTTVMLLQTARYLMKLVDSPYDSSLVKASEIGQSLRPIIGKKADFDVFTLRPKKAKSIVEMMDLGYLLQLFTFRTVAQVFSLNKALKKLLNQGMTFGEAWSKLTLKASRTGQSHVMCFMVSKFKEMVEASEDLKCQAAMRDVCVLFALSEIQDGFQWNGLLDVDQMELVELASIEVCDRIRPNAIGLTDAWDFHDKSLNSTIGRYDGNVYEAQYVANVQSPLNTDSVPEYFNVIKQYLDMDFLKLDNKICDPEVDPDDCSMYPIRPPTAKI